MRDDQAQASLDAGGDTDPATEAEETVTVGTKCKAGGSAGSMSRCILCNLTHTPVSDHVLSG